MKCAIRSPVSPSATLRPSLRERAATLKASAARVIRRKSVGSAPIATDPTLAAIAETRRLTEARYATAALPQPIGTIDPLPEQEAASSAFPLSPVAWAV